PDTLSQLVPAEDVDRCDKRLGQECVGDARGGVVAGEGSPCRADGADRDECPDKPEHGVGEGSRCERQPVRRPSTETVDEHGSESTHNRSTVPTRGRPVHPIPMITLSMFRVALPAVHTWQGHPTPA